MSMFCGIYYPEGNNTGRQDISKMVTALSFWNPDKTEVYTDDSIAMACLMLHTTPESAGETIPLIHEKYVLNASARIDNREVLNHELGLTMLHNDIIYLAQSYEKWGAGCPIKLYGDFAAAIFNREENSLFCFRDPLGTVPFFYYAGKDRFIFSTSLKGILALDGIDTTPDGQWIADSLFALRSETDRTVYKRIKRLPPGYILTAGKEGIKTTRYYEWQEQKKISALPEEEYRALFKEKLYRAIRERMRSVSPVSVELSGGLDSSAVAAIAARYNRIKAFTHILPDEHYHPHTDERQWASLLCQQAGITDHYLVGSEDKGLLAAIQEWLDTGAEPSQQKFHILSTGLYEEVQKHGSSVLLSGFGGDELISSAAGDYLMRLARERMWPVLWNELKGKEEYSVAAQKFLKIYFKRFLPVRNRIRHALNTTTANAVTIRRYNLTQRYRSVFSSQGNVSFTRRYCEILNGPTLSRRLEACALAALPYRIVYRYPLLDRALIELFISLPSSIKYSERMGRYFFRETMTDILPDEIRLRKDKYSYAIPSVFYRFFNDLEDIELYILGASQNPAQRFIDHKKLIRRFESLRLNQKDQNALAFFNALEIMLFFEMPDNHS